MRNRMLVSDEESPKFAIMVDKISGMKPSNEIGDVQLIITRI